MDKTEIFTNLGVVLAGMLGVWVAYFKKPPPSQPDTVLTGVGMELGNRIQMDMLVEQVRRCADYLAILADQKQANIESKLDDLLERMDRPR